MGLFAAAPVRAVCACRRRAGSLCAMKRLACRLKRAVDPEGVGMSGGIVAVIILPRAAPAQSSAKNESSRGPAQANAPIVSGAGSAAAAVGIEWNEQAGVALNCEVMTCRNLCIQLGISRRAAPQIMRREIDTGG